MRGMPLKGPLKGSYKGYDKGYYEGFNMGGLIIRIGSSIKTTREPQHTPKVT